MKTFFKVIGALFVGHVIYGVGWINGIIDLTRAQQQAEKKE